jgi:hypothetical protein
MQSPGSAGAGAARLWRPAAQRHVRNAWAAMHAERAAWASASSASFQAASALVNLALSRRYRVLLCQRQVWGEAKNAYRCREFFELLLGSAIIRLRTPRFMNSVEFFCGFHAPLTMACCCRLNGALVAGFLPQWTWGCCKTWTPSARRHLQRWGGNRCVIFDSFFVREDFYQNSWIWKSIVLCVSGCIFCACCRN